MMLMSKWYDWRKTQKQYSMTNNMTAINIFINSIVCNKFVVLILVKYDKILHRLAANYPSTSAFKSHELSWTLYFCKQLFVFELLQCTDQWIMYSKFELILKKCFLLDVSATNHVLNTSCFLTNSKWY